MTLFSGLLFLFNLVLAWHLLRSSYFHEDHRIAITKAITAVLAHELADDNGAMVCTITIAPKSCHVHSVLITTPEQQERINAITFTHYQATMATFHLGWWTQVWNRRTFPVHTTVSVHMRLQARAHAQHQNSLHTTLNTVTA